MPTLGKRRSRTFAGHAAWSTTPARWNTPSLFSRFKSVELSPFFHVHRLHLNCNSHLSMHVSFLFFNYATYGHGWVESCFTIIVIDQGHKFQVCPRPKLYFLASFWMILGYLMLCDNLLLILRQSFPPIASPLVLEVERMNWSILGSQFFISFLEKYLSPRFGLIYPCGR